MTSNELPSKMRLTLQPINRNRLLESFYANDTPNGGQDIQITMTADEIIQHHIQALGLADQRLVSRATNQLVQIGEAAVYPLINVLRHENRMVSIQAKAALNAIGQPAIKPLIEALNDAHLRMIVKTILATFGDAAIEPMLDTLEEADELLATAICSTFGMMGPSALDMLADVIDAKDEPYKTRLSDCIEIANRGER